MEQVFDNFVYYEQQAENFSLSLKGNLPNCSDSIDLPMPLPQTGLAFSLVGCLSWNTLEIVKSKLYSLSLSVADAVFHCAKRIFRHAIAGVKHFRSSRERVKRMDAAKLLMALRL